jgi:hypothetical protein
MDFLEFYLFYIISEKNVTNNNNKIKRNIQMNRNSNVLIKKYLHE